MSIREELEEEMSKLIQKEIDNEAMTMMLVSMWWYQVELSRQDVSEVAVTDWCTENSTGKYKIFWPTVVFEKQEDTVLFKLKWA